MEKKVKTRKRHASVNHRVERATLKEHENEFRGRNVVVIGKENFGRVHELYQLSHKHLYNLNDESVVDTSGINLG